MSTPTAHRAVFSNLLDSCYLRDAGPCDGPVAYCLRLQPMPNVVACCPRHTADWRRESPETIAEIWSIR